MLSVPYSPDVPPALVELVEHHARLAGVSLEALEVIGASLDFVEAFIVAAEDGQALEFVSRHFASGVAPSGNVERARWQAARLFG
jgi:hypothetical protein